MASRIPSCAEKQDIPCAMAWQPQAEPLNQLAQCLRDSLSGHDPTAQKNAELVSTEQSKVDIKGRVTNFVIRCSGKPSSHRISTTT